MKRQRSGRLAPGRCAFLKRRAAAGEESGGRDGREWGLTNLRLRRIVEPDKFGDPPFFDIRGSFYGKKGWFWTSVIC